MLCDAQREKREGEEARAKLVREKSALQEVPPRATRFRLSHTAMSQIIDDLREQLAVFRVRPPPEDLKLGAAR